MIKLYWTMNKETKNKDLKGWQENLLGFIATLVIVIFLALFYNDIVFTKGETTNSKAMRQFFRYLDGKFGKEYVFGFVIIVMVLFGIAALVGYMKEEQKNEDKNQP